MVPWGKNRELLHTFSMLFYNFSNVIPASTYGKALGLRIGSGLEIRESIMTFVLEV